MSIHGTADETVPYAEGEIVFTGIPIIDVDGSSIVHAMADSVGLDNCLIPVEGAGHVPHIFDETYYDLTLSTVAGKLGEWACEGYVPVCGGYDYTAETSVSNAAPPCLCCSPTLQAPKAVCSRPSTPGPSGPWSMRLVRWWNAAWPRRATKSCGQAWLQDGTPCAAQQEARRWSFSLDANDGVQVHASCAALKVLTWACTTVFTSGE